MGVLTQTLPEGFQDKIQILSGVISTDFTPSTPNFDTMTILRATSGGIQITCTPTLVNFFDDVDNVPTNSKEGVHVTGYECKMSGTSVTADLDCVASDIGTADINTTNGTVTPRMNVETTDFKTLYWVSELTKENTFCWVKLDNAMSTGGFSLQTTDKEKGKFSFEYTGYASINSPNEVPFQYGEKTIVSNGGNE